MQYVKICDAYGAGFFYIPGTETCLRVGGLVLAQMRIQGASELYAMAPPGPGSAVGAIAGTPFIGALPGASFFRPSYGTGRDIVGYDAVARIELDARTQSPWGTVRTFIRLQSAFGSGLNATTGSLSSALNGGNLANAANTTAGATIAKEVTWVDKAFIQFAGITMGRMQSMFDFYADVVSFEPLRGSNQNVWGLAYTATFGGGFSGTLSIEDTQSHRGNIGNAMNIAGIPGLAAIGAPGAVAAGGFGATATASRMPDIVANLRVDQPWGSAQLSAALHPVRAALYPGAATAFGPILGGPTAYAYPYAQSNSFGFALQGGLKFNLDQIAPGDQLWLQATYAKGAIGYVNGSNMAFFSGVNGTANYGVGLLRLSNAYGWTVQPDFDCVFTYSGACEKSSAWAITAAFKHYWTSTVSSGLFGGAYRVAYTNNALTPISPINGVPSVGMTNYTEFRLGTNLVWSPVRNFDIGGELMWMRGVTSRPFGLAPDAALQSRLLPAFKATTDAFYGKVRMLRAF